MPHSYLQCSGFVGFATYFSTKRRFRGNKLFDANNPRISLPIIACIIYISLHIIIYNCISLYIIVYFDHQDENQSNQHCQPKCHAHINLHEIKMRIFISRRSSPPHGHHLHQHQRAGDAEDEFTHLCDLIDFAAEMNFKLDDINKHSFNEFQLRCSVLIAGILQLEYWLKPIIIIIINQDRNCCRSSCLWRNRSHKTSV